MLNDAKKCSEPFFLHPYYCRLVLPVKTERKTQHQNPIAWYSPRQNGTTNIQWITHCGCLYKSKKFSRRFGQKNFLTSCYDFVYRKYGVTSADFNNSFQYYLHNPADMDSIYVRVLEKLNLEDLKLKKNMVDSLPQSAIISVDTNNIKVQN
jgi:hypothetical protein